MWHKEQKPNPCKEVLALQRQTTITINNVCYDTETPGNRTLLEFIRNQLGLTGSKESCGTGDCGSCSMIVDGKVIKSCLVLTQEMNGYHVTTIEGLSLGGELHPIQQAFVENWGTQCGYCTPGFIMASKALLDDNPHPSDEEIKHATAGNLCRCTGYIKIMDSIKQAAQILQEKGGGRNGG
jgi:carbon-monoxide dehydrogenase small subunit